MSSPKEKFKQNMIQGFRDGSLGKTLREIKQDGEDQVAADTNDGGTSLNDESQSEDLHAIGEPAADIDDEDTF